MTEALIFAGANLVLCACIVVVCLCRLNLMNKKVLHRVRSEYAGYIGGAFVSGLQPMWGEWPQWGSIALAGALLLGLIFGGVGWRGGPPASATEAAPLGKD